MKERKPTQARQMMRYISIPLALAAIAVVMKQRQKMLELTGAADQAAESGSLLDAATESSGLNPNFADAEPALTISWSANTAERTTLVLAAPRPLYAALLLRKPDDSIQVARPLIFIGEEGEQRFSLGPAAYEGTYCASTAPSPAALQTQLAAIDKAQEAAICAETLEAAQLSDESSVQP